MRLAALFLLLIALPGCGSARERECRVLLPRLDEAEVATSIVLNARPDVTRAYALLASRSGAARAWLSHGRRRRAARSLARDSLQSGERGEATTVDAPAVDLVARLRRRAMKAGAVLARRNTVVGTASLASIPSSR